MSNGDSSRDLFGMVKTWPLKKGCLWPPTFGDEKVTAAESPGSGAFLIMHSFCGHFAPSKPKLNPTNLEILDSPLIGKVLKTPKKNIQPSCDAYRLEVWWKNKTSWEKKLMIITCTSAPSRSRYPIFQLYICIYIYMMSFLYDWTSFPVMIFFLEKIQVPEFCTLNFFRFLLKQIPPLQCRKSSLLPPPCHLIHRWSSWKHERRHHLRERGRVLPGTLNNHFVLWMEMVKQPSFYVMIWNHPVEATIKNWLFGVPGGSYMCFVCLKLGGKLPYFCRQNPPVFCSHQFEGKIGGLRSKYQSKRFWGFWGFDFE